MIEDEVGNKDLGIPDSIMKKMPEVARSRGLGVDGGDSSLQLVSSLLDH